MAVDQSTITYTDDGAAFALRELVEGLEALQCQLGNFRGAAGLLGSMLDEPDTPAQENAVVCFAAENILGALHEKAGELVKDAMRLARWAKLRHGLPAAESAA